VVSLEVEGRPWLVPDGVTAHQMTKWHVHARERLDLATPHLCGRHGAVQAGGCLGIWPALLALEYGFEQVISFEPDPDNFACLSRNVQGLDRVRVVNAGLGERWELVPWLVDRKGRPGWHRVAPPGSVTADHRIRLLRLDDAVSEADCAIDLIALDVEGYELPALQGAGWLIPFNHPVIIIEDLWRSQRQSYRRLSGTAYGLAPMAIQEWLADHGYRKVAEVKNDEIWACK
jgi:FkbM family methyltransferase